MTWHGGGKARLISPRAYLRQPSQSLIDSRPFAAAMEVNSAYFGE